MLGILFFNLKEKEEGDEETDILVANLFTMH